MSKNMKLKRIAYLLLTWIEVAFEWAAKKSYFGMEGAIELSPMIYVFFQRKSSMNLR